MNLLWQLISDEGDSKIQKWFISGILDSLAGVKKVFESFVVKES